MTIETAKRILAHHGIEFRSVGDWLEVESGWTTPDGDTIRTGSEWVGCPRTVPELKRWLGY